MKSLSGEIWKELPEAAPGTLVSNKGRAKRNNKLLGTTLNKDGYYITSYGGEYGRKLVHRTVALLFVTNDDPEHKTIVDHISGDKLDNSADNLRWVTSGENTKAAYDLGLIKRGRKGFIVIKEIATDFVKIFKTITNAASSIRADSKQLQQVIAGSRKSHKGYFAYKIVEELNNDEYSLSISNNGYMDKKDYRELVRDFINNESIINNKL